MSSLTAVIDQIQARRRDLTTTYQIPGLWVDGVSTGPVHVNPFDFYHKRLSEIASAEPQGMVQSPGGGEWSQHAIVYNLFPRVTAAFDHNADGRLQIGPTADGWRETGTLLKCIALLPYIRSLGFNTVHLLPITAIGKDGNKGTLGSPYAIRNPYKLDESLDEPVLGLTPDQLFSAFVEAAHLLGLQVIVEFVLRTASRDGDWIKEHPDWFYWIRADVPDRTGSGSGDLAGYGNPVFPADVLAVLKAKVQAHDFTWLPPPPQAYRDLFTRPPRPEQVAMENGRYIGTLDDGTRVRIPGAFADWPPDDNQPPWGDVTYLRMYDHPDFNYIAYNTIRMYDEGLAIPANANQPLWDAIVGIIPHYQNSFGVDGVMIDMGHALPMPLKQRVVATARGINPDFAFWDENFAISQQTRDEGYNAVMGYWMFDAHNPEAVGRFVSRMAHQAFPIPFFAAPENHNTPRAASRPGGTTYSHYVLALSITLPGLPFILSGFELGETQPINTGLGFTDEQLLQYPSDKLPLFSEWAFNWLRPDNMVKSVRYAISLRAKLAEVFGSNSPDSCLLGYSDNPAILVYSRKKDDRWISVIVNTDQSQEQSGRVVVNARPMRVPGLWGTSDSGMDMYQEAMANVTLSPGYVLILDGSNLVDNHRK